MKKIVLYTLLSLGTLAYAGGKQVSPADASVVAIPEAAHPSPWYLGAGLVFADFRGCDLPSGCKYEDVTYGTMLRGGYDINEYFGIEARGIKTFLDKGPFGGVPLAHAGFYAKPQYPITERTNIYALLGYGYTKNLGNGNRLNYFDSDSGFSAGVGLEFDLSDKQNDFIQDANYDRPFDGYADQGRGWSLFVDYQRLLIKSSVAKMDVISFGLRYDF